LQNVFKASKIKASQRGLPQEVLALRGFETLMIMGNKMRLIRSQEALALRGFETVEPPHHTTSSAMSKEVLALRGFEKLRKLHG
jgi:hypothetical protein